MISSKKCFSNLTCTYSLYSSASFLWSLRARLKETASASKSTIWQRMSLMRLNSRVIQILKTLQSTRFTLCCMTCSQKEMPQSRSLRRITIFLQSQALSCQSMRFHGFQTGCSKLSHYCTPTLGRMFRLPFLRRILSFLTFKSLCWNLLQKWLMPFWTHILQRSKTTLSWCFSGWGLF